MAQRKTLPEIIDGFEARVKRRGEDECWLWLGAKNEFGYGVCSFGLAHRLCWTITFGPIPDGMNVLHRCDVRACNNPAHLFLGTQADNVADCVSKGRQAGAVGQRNAACILTPSMVLKMRALYKSGEFYYREIAACFGVSQPCAAQAITGYTWGHVK